MSTQPFFSVVIPTKNRSTLVADAIQSVMLQSFGEYEVVVSDNFNDEKTRHAIAPFRDDVRLKYYRTDSELSMPDHWEFATAKAHGRYVLVLTDRSVLKQGALEKIHRLIVSDDEKTPVYSWRWSTFDDARKILTDDMTWAHSGEVSVLDPARVARAFLDTFRAHDYALPRGLNSCYRHDIAREIRRKFGRLFAPISPDYASAFLLLAHVPQLVHMSETLYIFRASPLSNGATAFVLTGLPYLETLGIENFYEYVPIKAPIVENVIMDDFLRVQRRAGGNLEGLSVNWAAYFVACYRELLVKARTAFISAAVLGDLFAEWDRALTEFDPPTRDAVKTAISRLRTPRLRAQLKIVMKRSPLGPFLVGLKRHIEASRPFIGASRRFKRVLDAAGFGVQAP